MAYDAETPFHPDDGDPPIPPDVLALCARLMALPASARRDLAWELEERIIRDHPLTWEVALHLRDLGMVIEPPSVGALTPWGFAQTAEPLGEHAVRITTAGHGGIWVSPAGVALMPWPDQMPRCGVPGWFEEDMDWAAPYVHLRLWTQIEDGPTELEARRVLRDRDG